MKCVHCNNDLIDYEGSQGQSLQCVNCKLIYNAEYMKQAQPVFDRGSLEIEMIIAQKDNAYTERNKCIAALANLIRDIALPNFRVFVTNHPEEDESWDNDWRTILVIQKGDLQMTWHFHDSDKHLLKRLPVMSYIWDGHSTDEKYNRLLNIFIRG